jgi:hypothetical protein
MFENRVHEDRFLLSSSCVQGSSAIEYARTTPRSQLSPAETGILSHLYIKTIFCQDRLGTNIGKTQKKMPFSLPGIAACSGWLFCQATIVSV